MIKSPRGRVLLPAFASVLFVIAVSGCRTICFYSQAAHGQYQIFANQTPIDTLIKDPATDGKLTNQLQLVKKIRLFAADELKLRPGGSYLKYADLHRQYVIWNVTVAPSLSLEPKTWWFPIVGSASYRGYFSEPGARDYAAIWQKSGWDTYVGDVTTYSTLGWFDDPLLNTFIYEPEAELADTIFHELTHERLFVAGDTDFNEALAVMVASEGVRRWYQGSANTQAYERYLTDTAREHDFVDLVMAARKELQSVYDDRALSNAEKLKGKAAAIERMRGNYVKTRQRWGVAKSGYDYWFDEPVNNAQLNTVAAYYDLVPAFQALLRAKGGDLSAFFTTVEGLAKLPLEQRHEALRAYLRPG